MLPMFYISSLFPLAGMLWQCWHIYWSVFSAMLVAEVSASLRSDCGQGGCQGEELLWHWVSSDPSELCMAWTQRPAHRQARSLAHIDNRSLWLVIIPWLSLSRVQDSKANQILGHFSILPRLPDSLEVMSRSDWPTDRHRRDNLNGQETHVQIHTERLNRKENLILFEMFCVKFHVS